MHELKAKIDRLCKLKEPLMAALEAQFTNGLECVNTAEAGAVVDMIKDLCEAEKDLTKAKYYQLCSEEMVYGEEESDWNGRAGYDHWRYSSGRYAPKGRGSYSRRVGYVPPIDYMTYRDPFMDPTGEWNPKSMTNDRLGYPGERDGIKMGDRMTPYEKYKDARRHYTESHSKQDREMMDQQATGHMMETIETVKDIWRDATPELKKKMKSDLTSLMSEMTI